LEEPRVSIIALDVGSRRIGVAVTDPGETFSFPHTMIERTNLRADLERILAIASEYAATTIVVGDPLRLSGERGPASEKMDRFCDSLAAVFHGAIERIDERLTTSQVTRGLIDADVSRKKRKQVVDQLAASLILDSYLARRKNALGRTETP